MNVKSPVSSLFILCIMQPLCRFPGTPSSVPLILWHSPFLNIKIFSVRPFTGCLLLVIFTLHPLVPRPLLVKFLFLFVSVSGAPPSYGPHESLPVSPVTLTSSHSLFSPSSTPVSRHIRHIYPPA